MNGHHYSSCDDVLTHGPIQVAVGFLDSGSSHIIVGNMLEDDFADLVFLFEDQAEDYKDCGGSLNDAFGT